MYVDIQKANRAKKLIREYLEQRVEGIKDPFPLIRLTYPDLSGYDYYRAAKDLEDLNKNRRTFDRAEELGILFFDFRAENPPIYTVKFKEGQDIELVIAAVDRSLDGSQINPVSLDLSEKLCVYLFDRLDHYTYDRNKSIELDNVLTTRLKSLFEKDGGCEAFCFLINQI